MGIAVREVTTSGGGVVKVGVVSTEGSIDVAVTPSGVRH